MPTPLLAMLGAFEILFIFIGLALLGTAALGLVVWLVHTIRTSAARPPTPGAPPPGVGAPPRPAGGAGSGAAVVGSADLRPLGACPRCGTALGEGAPAGLCPKCLLAVGLGTQPEAPGAGATASVPPDPTELAALFPQYEIFEAIGQGGMGVVYRAKQRKLDRVVALKILPRVAARDPAFAERFHREARTLARLNHPSIVTVYDFGEAGGLYFLVMEYVDGADLRRVLEQGRLSPAEALRIVPVVCDALQYAHANGVVHRDIKPGNILLDREGRVKIADFGIAKLAGPAAEGVDITLTQSRQSMGTPHYMAPEQVENPQSVDHRADIYSLGVVFYEMLTGELPLGRFAPPSRRVQVDVRLDEVVLRALEKEPERRYQQVGEVKTELARLGGGESGTAPCAAAVGAGGSPGVGAAPGWPEPGAPGDTPRPGAGWKLVLGVMWAGLFLIFLATWSGLGRRHPGDLLGEPNPVGITLATLGAWAPVATTFLGLLALREALRRGERGLRRWLALALTGLFPALTLLVLVFAGAAALVIGIFGRPNLGATLLFAVLMAGSLGVWWLPRLIRRLRVFLVSDAGRGAGGWIPGVSGRWSIPAVMGVGLIEVVLVMGMLVLFAQSVHHARGALAVSASGPAFAVDPATGTLSVRRPIRMTPAGPRLDDWLWVGPLSGFPASHQTAIDEALAAAWVDYRAALRRHASRSTNSAGHTVFAIPQFRSEIDAIEGRFWTTVDNGVDARMRGSLRAVLGARLRARPGGNWLERESGPPEIGGGGDPREVLALEPLLAFGESAVTVEVWSVGAWFRWLLAAGVASPEGVPESAGATPHERSELPEFIRRLEDLLGPGAGERAESEEANRP